MLLNNNNVYKFFIAIVIPVLAAGCETAVHRVQPGDNNMSCEQLRAELGIKVDSFDDSEKKKKLGAGVAAGGLGIALLAPLSVITAPVLIPALIMGGTGYAGVNQIKSGENGERIAHLTDIYNKKGCASSTYAATGRTQKRDVIRDKELIKIQKALAENGYECGTPDGIYGNKTRTALESFQQDNGLEITGKADDATKNILLNESIFSSIGDTLNGLSKSTTVEEESDGTTNID